MWRNWTSHIADENATWYNYSGKHFGSLFKSKHMPTTPRYLFKRNDSICAHKVLYTNAHSSFICNSQKLKTTQMSINWQMNKQTVVQAYNGILPSSMKGWTTNDMDGSQTEWCCMKELRHKRAHFFHLHRTLDNASWSMVTESRSVPGIGGLGGPGCKAGTREHKGH